MWVESIQMRIIVHRFKVGKKDKVEPEGDESFRE